MTPNPHLVFVITLTLSFLAKDLNAKEFYSLLRPGQIIEDLNGYPLSLLERTKKWRFAEPAFQTQNRADFLEILSVSTTGMISHIL